MLYDLTALQRDANSALRLHRHPHAGRRPGLLRAAQGHHLPADELAVPVRRPRVVAALDRAARRRGRPRLRGARRLRARSRRAAARPHRQRREGHRPPRDHPDRRPPRRVALSRDERRIYDLVARRFLAVFHPDARYEQTTIETEAAKERFRSRGKVLIDAGWRAAYGAVADADKDKTDDEADGEQDLPLLHEGDVVHCAEAEVLAKQTKPPAHYSDATLLRAMETAGRLVEDDEAAEAMKESGLGTPATRAATIERLIDKEYLERAGPGAARHRPRDRPHLRRSATTRWPRRR